MYNLFKLCSQLAAAFAILFLVLIFPAHAMTLPIHGAVLNSTETFTGKATVHFWGDGNLTLTTNKGVICKGDFVHASQQKGNGTVTCEDGRLGSFEFVTAGFSGTGAGMIGAEHFDFRIGK
ncbi:hypothetical protein DesfrDRAFT_1675 [Solidesulfovibrio fructosivorans JJ]]|uniref:Uncharacterized protein n=1 Tax=Solidesulfovibrio fructosivorans JJ] TaxID=596151 RepID=E1JVM6_SOLFR|nr:hypothetical protein [Solidesulfovibrio fructosivorans]EFL51514.1 hypothetical protein DesfrDRAFT_1675 [Solidesulfovibrio fructosivorans JJ]]